MDSKDAKTPFYSKSVSDVISAAKVSEEQGLTESEVSELRLKYGENCLAEAAPIPIWKKIAAQFQELVIWILIVAAILAGFLGEWIDTSAILIIVLLNGALGFMQEERASRALAKLKALSSPKAKAIRGGTLVSIPADELVPNDIIHLEAGDQVPADARLLEAYNVSTQEASLTGESVPVEKNAQIVLPQNAPIGDRVNSVFMGTIVTNGKALGLVTNIGMNTELGRIANILGTNKDGPTPLQRRLAELGRVLILVCLILVGLIFAIQYLRGGQLLETLLVSISLAVAAVPEGLPAVVTIALAIGLQRMVKRNALIRKLPSVETLGSVTVICSDKTGTLTRNEMTVREIIAGGKRWSVTGSGYEPKGKFERQSPEVDDSLHDPLDRDLEQLLAIGATCNNAKVSPGDPGMPWQVIGDPTEGALIVAAQKAGLKVSSNQKVIFEIPFNSERKMMSVILPDTKTESTSESLVLFAKGAPEVILDQCKNEIWDGSIRRLTPNRRLDILKQNDDMANRALRVLGFAFLPNPDQDSGRFQETDMTFVGLAGMIDPPREEVRKAVKECHDAGIRPVMITGDHPATAIAIARELNIADPDCTAVTGAEIDGYDDDRLKKDIDRIAVYARVSAVHKLRVVKTLQERHQVVAMTGDGVNDAPAVKGADIGIAMGITGTDVTKESADMVLTDDNFTSIVNAIREGRGIFDNIQKFVHYLLSCNAGEVILMFIAALFGMPLPLLAIQILWINLVTDGLPALALALERPERDIMSRPPRPPRQPVITWRSGTQILSHGLLIATAAFVGFVWIYSADAHNLDIARSATFAIAAFSQLAFALVCRSQRFTLPQLGVFSNYWLFVAFATSGLLQLGVMTIPDLQKIFGTVPISLEYWPLILVLSLAPATVIEITKLTKNFIMNVENQNSNREPQ